MNWIMKRLVKNLLDPKNSEFWTGPVNIILQLILKLTSSLMPESQIAAFENDLRNWLMMMLPYAAGRLISKGVKPDA